MILNQSGIYAIRNSENGRMYIGSARELKRRWREHVYKLARGRHSSPSLQASWRKRGKDAFSFDVVEFVEDKNSLLAREQVWIDFWRPYYNVARVAAAPMLGRKHSPETIKKMSAVARADGRGGIVGHVVSAETKQKLSLANRGNKSAFGIKRHPDTIAHLIGNKRSAGHRHSDETRALMSERQRGHSVSETTRKKLSQAAIGNKRSVGHQPRLGSKASDATRAKMSAAQLGRTHTAETRAKISATKKANAKRGAQ